MRQTCQEAVISRITIGEELLLLVLDYDTGCINYRVPNDVVHIALGAAVLTDLALAGRIDTGLDSLFLLDPTPMGEPAADRVLERIVQDENQQTVDHWLSAITDDIDALRSRLTDRLVKRGVLLRGPLGRIWIIGSRDGRDADGDPLRDVRHRLAGELLGNDIPDPRDITIIGLADACDLWGKLMDETTLQEVRPRIDLYSRMDLICHAVTRAIGAEPAPAPEAKPARGTKTRKGQRPFRAGSNIGFEVPSHG